MASPPVVRAFFDQDTYSYSYVVSDPATHQAVVIDPVHNFDPASGTLRSSSADLIVQFVHEQNLQVDWILETHIHADHLSASGYLKASLGARIAIGAQVSCVQERFSTILNPDPDFHCDGSQFDQLLNDNDELAVGTLSVLALHTPGHTPACMSYVIGNCAFIGDTLFMPDYGTARTDFPGGDARTLYQSIKRILSLPADTRLFMCHDYGTKHRTEFCCETSVEEQRTKNIHLLQCTSEDTFAAYRQCRDKNLSAPRLLYPAVQYNLRGGQLPPAESNGRSYLKIPVRNA